MKSPASYSGHALSPGPVYPLCIGESPASHPSAILVIRITVILEYLCSRNSVYLMMTLKQGLE